jgi:hypothetical protein
MIKTAEGAYEMELQSGTKKRREDKEKRIDLRKVEDG